MDQKITEEERICGKRDSREVKKKKANTDNGALKIMTVCHFMCTLLRRSLSQKNKVAWADVSGGGVKACLGRFELGMWYCV